MSLRVILTAAIFTAAAAMPAATTQASTSTAGSKPSNRTTGGKTSCASPRVGASATKLTTLCNTNTPLPTGYVEIPLNKLPSGVNPPPTDGACADGDAPDGKCWADLNLDTYVAWWWSTFNATCEGQTFADCFYIQETRYAPSKCGQLNSEAACDQPKWADFRDNWNGVQHFYIAWTIYNINRFFLDYYNAIGDAQTTATDMLGSIINIVHPPEPINMGLNAALTALSAGLAFLPGPAAPLAAALKTAAQQAPGIAKFIWPSGTTTQTMDWNKISGSLGVLASTLQSNVSQAVPEIQNNIDTFRVFANTGAFTGNLPPLDNLKNDILSGLNTFTISEAYKSQSVFITRQTNTNVQTLTSNGTSLTWPIDYPSYDSTGVCGDFFYDGNIDTTYGLVKGDGMGHRFNEDLPKWFQAQNGVAFPLTSGVQLFSGADKCQQAHCQSGPVVNITDGSFSIACLSSMNVCTWGMTPTGPGHEDDWLFTDCDLGEVMKTWRHGNCDGDGVGLGGSVPVPWTYLGWGESGNEDNGYHGFCLSDQRIW